MHETARVHSDIAFAYGEVTRDLSSWFVRASIRSTSSAAHVVLVHAQACVARVEISATSCASVGGR